LLSDFSFPLMNSSTNFTNLLASSVSILASSWPSVQISSWMT
jgi:hypothetical protein